MNLHSAHHGIVHFFEKWFLFPFRVKYRHSIPFVREGRVLDIGCGNGTELYKLKAMGWETHGVEMDDQASERARSKGIPVFTGDLFRANYPDQFFHVVRMSFVLEHLPNPRETLREIRRILMPEGRIYLSVQNARSLHYWLFGPRWFSLDVPRHLFTFTPATIERLFSSLDLRLKAVWFDSGTRSFLASLQYIVNDRYQRGAGYSASQSYKQLVLAIGMVETKRDTLAYNPVEEAAGYFQIRPIRLLDYNNRTGSNYTMKDLFNYEISEKIFLYYR